MGGNSFLHCSGALGVLVSVVRIAHSVAVSNIQHYYLEYHVVILCEARTPSTTTFQPLSSGSVLWLSRRNNPGTLTAGFLSYQSSLTAPPTTGSFQATFTPNGCESSQHNTHHICSNSRRRSESCAQRWVIAILEMDTQLTKKLTRHVPPQSSL
jgi:hypothetical protein